jgi:hypothetical protein
MIVRILLTAEVEYEHAADEHLHRDLEIAIARFCEIEEGRLAESLKHMPGLKFAFGPGPEENGV